MHYSYRITVVFTAYCKLVNIDGSIKWQKVQADRSENYRCGTHTGEYNPVEMSSSICFKYFSGIDTTQATFDCSKSAIETPEGCV